MALRPLHELHHLIGRYKGGSSLSERKTIIALQRQLKLIFVANNNLLSSLFSDIMMVYWEYEPL